MTNKYQELELRLVMEGMEELATFISHHCDCSQLRILSIETEEEAAIRELAEKSANVIAIESRRQSGQASSHISRSLSLNDRHYRS